MAKAKQKTDKNKTKTPTNDLPESDVISLMRDQLGKKLNARAAAWKPPGMQQQDQQGKEGKSPGTVVSPGLKLRRKEDNMLVTVDSVGQHSVVVAFANGELFNIPTKELDEKFELD